MTEPVETFEEKARRLGVPLIRPLLPENPVRNPDIVGVCGKCGLELHRMMGYYCPRANCPTGLGGSSSM